jgi:1-phosphatidylinositol-3-phosphate 5-kinase
MEPPRVASPVLSTLGTSSRTRSNTKLADDVTSLTSFNPFSEEDENDQSSFTLVTSIFSRMKNTLTAPLSSAVSATSANTNFNTNGIANELRRPPFTTQHSYSSLPPRAAVAERPNSLSAAPSIPAPPLVSVIPAVPEAPSYDLGSDKFSSRGAMVYSPEGGLFATGIPGFPIPDDARSIRTATSFQRPGSVSKVIRRVRGEGQWSRFV